MGEGLKRAFAATKATRTVAARIKHLEPCQDATKWAKGYTSPVKAWRECQRGDWMLWLVGKVSGPPESEGRKKLVLCACECARLALPIFENRYLNDGRVRKCIETAERWAKGEATIEELRQARSAAYAAYAAAAYAAYVAADAADAYAAAYAAAAYAADAYAADAYAADAARAKALAECADIVRKHYPKPPTLWEVANAP
jgi:hypothetical protein